MSKEKKNTPTFDEVADQANNKTRKRSIQLDFIDNALTVLSKFDEEKGSFYGDYTVNSLYTNLFDKLHDEEIDTNPAATSIYNIFISLGATPRKSTETIQKNYMFHDEGLIGSLSDPKTFYLQAIYAMANFINVSVYLYKKLAVIGREDMQGSIVNFLIVAASNAYEELYSSRGKIEFAYYFKKVIEYHADLEQEITPFKSDSWKSDFNKLTKNVKTDIDTIISTAQRSSILKAVEKLQWTNSHPAHPTLREFQYQLSVFPTIETRTIVISNLSITIGEITDRRINPKERRYIIEVAIADKEKSHHDRIFISTIQE